MTLRLRPERPSGRPAPRRAAAGLVGVLAAIVLTGCSIFPSGADPTGQNGDPLPDADASEYTSASLYLVALNGEYPPSTTGREVACQDLLVRAQSVPVKTEDLVGTAVGFLLGDEQYSHGDPALTNALDPSEDGLVYSSSRVEGDTVVLELTGDVATRSECESYRIRAQLNRTAAAAAGVPNAEIRVDGVPIEEILGLTELELGEEITTPPAETSGTEDADGTGGTEGGQEDPLDEIGDPGQLNGG